MVRLLILPFDELNRGFVIFTFSIKMENILQCYTVQNEATYFLLPNKNDVINLKKKINKNFGLGTVKSHFS